MAVAVVQDWVEPETEHSTEDYDRITERLGANHLITGRRWLV